MKLELSDLTCLIDRREQTPWDMSPMKVKHKSIPSGDYSIDGLERFIALERKNWNDMLNCIGGRRQEFENCVARLACLKHSAIVIEGVYSDVIAGNFGMSKLTVAQVKGAVHSWSRKVPVYFLESPATASDWAKSWLAARAKEIWIAARAADKAMREGA